MNVSKEAEVLSEKLANKYRPRFFKDYLTQGESTPVDVLTKAIAKNLHSSLGNVGIFSEPGTGKTSLARLYATATLCYNRQEGEYEPCGKCPVCLGEDVSNISQYTIHNTTAAWEPLRELISISRTPPVINREGIRADQYRRFIILDEVQNASPELLALLNDALEFGPEETTWIFISMDLNKLEAKSKATAGAITSRGIELYLPTFADSTIANALASKTQLHYDAALAIARLSKGNMRKAWSNFAIFKTLVEDEAEITESIVLYSRSGGATKESRLEMWKALGESNADKLKEIVTEWTNNAADFKLLGELLLRDIIDNLSNSIEVQSLLRALSRWYDGTAHPLVLLTTLMSHLGTNVIKFPSPQERELRKHIKETVVVKPEMTVAEIVIQQTNKAVANTNKVPVILLVSSYRELMLHYQNEGN